MMPTVLSVLFCSWLCQVKQDRDSLIINKIVKEMDQYRERAQYFQGEMDEVMTVNGQFVQKIKYRIKQNCTSRYIEQERTYVVGNESRKTAYISAYNANYGFTLAKRIGEMNKGYYLDSVYKHSDENAIAFNKDINNRIDQITKIPAYALLKASPGIALKLEEIDQGKYIKIHHINEHKGYDGWTLYDMMAGCLKKENYYRYKPTSEHHHYRNVKHSYEYAVSEGIIIPKRIVFSQWSEGTSEGSNQIEKLYHMFYDEGVDELQFTLSAFGMEEPFGITWERPTPWWIYFGLIGGGCLVGFVLIGVFLRRRYGAS